MSNAEIAPGCILHWEGFQFPDGQKANKYFVIVGAQLGKNYLAIIATSQQKWRKAEPGGNPEGGYYHIPGGRKDWFPEDTWLLFEEPVELSAAEFLKVVFEGKITTRGNLRPDIANAICNCMRKCDDVSEHHKSLLGPALQQKKKDG
jgi:hypothetical protein